MKLITAIEFPKKFRGKPRTPAYRGGEGICVGVGPRVDAYGGNAS